MARLSATTLLLVGVVFASVAYGANRVAPPSNEATSSVEWTSVAVEVGDLTREYRFGGTVSYGESRTILTELTGTITRCPSEDGITSTDPLLWVGGRPVHVVPGAEPLYRVLEQRQVGREDPQRGPSGLMAGLDVQQLQEFLLLSGQDDQGRLVADGEFGSSTRRAVFDWQGEVGHVQTGRMETNNLAFVAEPVRLAEPCTVGDTVEGVDVVEATPSIMARTPTLPAGLLEVGGDVTVYAADGEEFTGTVEGHSLAGDDEESDDPEVVVSVSIPETISIESARLELVETAVIAKDAILVPASAVVAQGESEYAVRRVRDGADELVSVDLLGVEGLTAAISGDVVLDDQVLIVDG